ncbi:MAG: hypothetical protein AAB733_04355, partial [Patescibacteria group bacterium]
WWWVWIFTGIVLLLSVVLINDWNVIGMMFVGLFIPPFFFWSGAYAIAMFFGFPFFQHLIAALSAGALWWFFENLFYYRYRPSEYLPYALENISSYLNIASSFFWFSTLFNFILLFNLQEGAVTMGATAMASALILQTFWVNKIAMKDYRVLWGVITLLMGEAFWIMHFSPLDPYVTGLLMTILLYVFVHLSRHHFLQSLSPNVIRRYFLIGGSVFLITLLSAQWT